MKERPIIFSAPMVRAILAGTKTQTRRIVKPQPERTEGGVLMWGASKRGMRFGVQGIDIPPGVFTRCPYGKPGDRLWVRETWQADPPIDDSWASTAWAGCKNAALSELPERFRHPTYCLYREEWLHGDIRWRPSIYMPRWASRLTLEVTGVRVERLQNISEADAIAEGIERHRCGSGWNRYSLPGDSESLHKEGKDGTLATAFPMLAYRSIWEQINGAGSWNANPWVWVVAFKRAANDAGVAA